MYANETIIWNVEKPEINGVLMNFQYLVILISSLAMLLSLESI